MIQFTIGCILLALTVFFGGKDLLNNNDIIKNTNRSVEQEESKLNKAKSIQNRFLSIKGSAILKSAEVKVNLINQLNINESKYNFTFSESEDNTKVLTTNSYDIAGYDSFGNIFNLISDIEKIKGLEIESICFNCEFDDEKLLKGLNEVGFKVKGKAYVYNEKQ